jgi:hypothetical protein
MKTARVGAYLLAGLIAGSTAARAQDEKVALENVPKAVLDAVKGKFSKGTVKTAEKEVEHGATTFEIDLEDEGKAVEVELKPDGTVLKIEKAIAARALPQAVSDVIAAGRPKATVQKAEEIVEFRDGKETKIYEVVMAQTGKRSIEIKLTPDGKVVKRNDD